MDPIPRPMVTLAAHSNGKVSLYLRLSSISLCIGGLVASICALTTGGSFLPIIPHAFTATSQITYLGFAYYCANIPHAVSITLDLVTLLFDLALGILFVPSIAVPSGWSCSQDYGGPECPVWIRIFEAQGASAIILCLVS